MISFYVVGAVVCVLIAVGLYSKLMGEKSVSEIVDDMNTPKPLPMGQKEFIAWSDRIISGALVPTQDTDSLRGVLATMLLHIGPTESHKPDAYFIHSLRKAAVNEVAHANFLAIKKAKEDKAKAEQARQESAPQALLSPAEEAEKASASIAAREQNLKK